MKRITTQSIMSVISVTPRLTKDMAKDIFDVISRKASRILTKPKFDLVRMSNGRWKMETKTVDSSGDPTFVNFVLEDSQKSSDIVLKLRVGNNPLKEIQSWDGDPRKVNTREIEKVLSKEDL